MKLLLLCAVLTLASATTELPAIAEFIINGSIRDASSLVRSPIDDQSYECVHSIMRTGMTEFFETFFDDISGLPDNRTQFQSLPALIEQATPLLDRTIEEIQRCPSGEMRHVVFEMSKPLLYIRHNLPSLSAHWPCVLENIVDSLIKDGLIEDNYSSCQRWCWNYKFDATMDAWTESCRRYACAATCVEADILRRCKDKFAAGAYYHLENSILEAFFFFQLKRAGVEEGDFPTECKFKRD